VAASERVSDRVHDALRRDILEGRLAPGDAVPSERALAAERGVNRHAVREALKRLEQAGLVRISQGGATRVLDWREHGGLEVLLDLVVGASGPPPAELVRSVLEMRASIGTHAARLCAERAGAADREEVARLAGAVAGARNADALDERYVGLWRAIVVGSGNVAYRLALNSLNQALVAYPGVAAAVRPAGTADVAALGEAIRTSDAGGAAAAAARLLDPAG
jgi:GntR family transcriptional regulator, transcriptional repressor for pyruvate dehydrogenase complex